jgi:hypothetical protein
VGFNPTLDLIRVVTDQRQNLAVNVDPGQVMAAGADLNPGTPRVTPPRPRHRPHEAARPHRRRSPDDDHRPRGLAGLTHPARRRGSRAGAPRRACHDGRVATLISVNAGRPAQIGVRRGRPVMSAIGKAPVEGRVRVAGVNVEGDDQADRRVHGGPDKAVYAYAAERVALRQ